VLVCYLDDSGKDPQNRITTLAGYVASDDAWRAFETEVETWFTEFGVSVLNAKDLHHTDGEFRGWTVLRKQAFIARLCQAMSHHLALGVSMSALKETYATRAAESDRKRTVTPYAFCFQVINDWILRDIRIGRTANADGVAYAIETGNEHNVEAEEQFHAVRKLHGLEGILRSICFVGKESCRAIQMADLVAFYSRRHGEAMARAPLKEWSDVSPEAVMSLIAGAVPIRAFVATDFGPEAQGRPF
jgi:hypothetical protein